LNRLGGELATAAVLSGSQFEEGLWNQVSRGVEVDVVQAVGVSKVSRMHHIYSRALLRLPELRSVNAGDSLCADEHVNVPIVIGWESYWVDIFCDSKIGPH